MAYSLKGLLKEMKKTYAAFTRDSQCADCDYQIDLKLYLEFLRYLKFFFDEQFHHSYDLVYWILEDKDYD